MSDLSVAANDVKPWLDASNYAILAKGQTRDGKEFSILAPPTAEQVAEWKKDPEYIAYLNEIKEHQFSDYEEAKKAFNSGYIGFIGNGETIFINIGARGRNTLTAEQLKYFQDKYGDMTTLDYDTKLRLYAELTELDVIDGRLAFREIRNSEVGSIYDYKTNQRTPISYDNVDKYLALLYERYIMEKKNLQALRSQKQYDLLQEQSQSYSADSIVKLHNVLSSIFGYSPK